MEFNSVLFRAPIPSYTASRFSEELIWIPGQKDNLIPCLFLRSHNLVSNTLIYFHANAEDLGKIYDFLDIMRCVLEINIIAPEYPGYGLYKGNPNCNQILSDSLNVYKFIQSIANLSISEITLAGRSMGTGPASWLASQGAGSLILISPYTSLRKVIKNLLGSFLQYMFKDQFKNIDYLSKVTCPTLIIHGKKDSLIPYQHAYELAKVCLGKTTVYLSETMSHNNFEFYDDVLKPIDLFFKENEISSEKCALIEIPKEYYKIPEYLELKQKIIEEFL